MDYVVAIPTYRREKVLQEKTLPLLLNAGVPASKIFLFVADKEEEAKYRESVPEDCYGKLVVGKKGISYQRNFIIDYFPQGKPIVFMDDDISQVVRKREGKVSPIADMDAFFKSSFGKARKNGVFLWTTKNMYNAFYKKQMKEEGEIGLMMFSGDLMGIFNRKDMKISLTLEKGEAEQIELLFKYYKRDGGILRFNNVVVISSKLTPGGKVAERGSVEARKRDIEPNIRALQKAYPDLIGSVSQRGKEAHTDRSRLRPADLPTKKVEGGATKQVLDGVDDTERDTLSIRNRERFNEVKEDLLKELRETRIPTIGNPRPEGSKRSTGRADVIGSIGRTITFGYGDTRAGIKEFATNKKHPKLLRLLAQLGNLVVPKGWTYNAITLNEGVKAKKHKDTKNLGRSVIIGIGDYEGGGIKVWDKDDKNPKVFNLKDTPVMFNGGLLFHQTTPFKGERYTIIYYKQMWDGKVKGVQMRGKGPKKMEVMSELEEDEARGGIFA